MTLSSPRAFAAVATLIVIAFFCGVSANLSPILGQNKFRDEAERSRSAAVMLEAVVSAPEAGGLRELLGKAEAIAVFPVVKEQTAFFLESAHGSGVISARGSDGWTTPAFYLIGSVRYRGIFVKGGKFGVILLFLRRNAMPACGKEIIILSSAKDVLPGPTGELSNVQKAENQNASIVVFGYYKRKLQSVPPQRKNWKEFTLNDEDRLNKRIYGIKTCDVLAGKKPEKSPPGITAFRDLLQKNFGALPSLDPR